MKHTKRQYKATHRQKAAKISRQVERMAVYTLHIGQPENKLLKRIEK